MQLVTPSLLIADDDRDFRETLREVFQPRGYRTILAADGEEALEILRSESIDVAVMDLHMPRLDGLQTVQRARETQILIPFILLTSALDEELMQVARQLDYFAALAKPISCSEITRIVREALDSHAN